MASYFNDKETLVAGKGLPTWDLGSYFMHDLSMAYRPWTMDHFN
jgi:hypothetical protein